MEVRRSIANWPSDRGRPPWVLFFMGLPHRAAMCSSCDWRVAWWQLKDTDKSSEDLTAFPLTKVHPHPHLSIERHSLHIICCYLSCCGSIHWVPFVLTGFANENCEAEAARESTVWHYGCRKRNQEQTKWIVRAEDQRTGHWLETELPLGLSVLGTLNCFHLSTQVTAWVCVESISMHAKWMHAHICKYIFVTFNIFEREVQSSNLEKCFLFDYKGFAKKKKKIGIS